jgi:hypothetical protein
MATIAAGTQSFSNASSSTTTSWAGINNNANTSSHYLINSGLKLRVIFSNAEALVVQPFVIEVKLTGEEYLATGDISNTYEFGSTPGNAIKNYLEILVDELLWLEKHEAELSPSVREDLHSLQNHIRIV